MNFSEVFKLSGLLCKFSPDGKYLASCVQYRLVVRDVHTLQILHLYTCLDQIQHIEWSADSLFILCAMYKRGQVQVWSLEQPEWHCRIDEGSAGLVASCWSPDGRHILNTTEFHDPPWLRGHLMPHGTGSGIPTPTRWLWRPPSAHLEQGTLPSETTKGPRRELAPHTDDATQASLEGHAAKLDATPHPGFHTGTVRLKACTQGWVRPTRVSSCSAHTCGLGQRTDDEIASVPVSLQTLKPVADRANPKIGIGALAFSPDSYFLATRSDSVPNAVWIWDIQKLRLFVVLEQLSPVRSFQWDPQQPRLAICTGGGKVYLWSPAGCVSVQVPGEGDFQVLSLCWHLNGDSLALLSKDHFCLCFLETKDRVGTAFGRPGDHT
ncbi:WD repeat-containing protein WRAP73 [Puma concolor]|uniref:WD repeat-containing protein WRAP73 n=1 Tax=Puma concolor TaxID=9696 RepID=A0A6P6GY13_PUMCO|nr:WD repeat-containing protein WRAP73 [Puma concolor]